MALRLDADGVAICLCPVVGDGVVAPWAAQIKHPKASSREPKNRTSMAAEAGAGRWKTEHVRRGAMVALAPSDSLATARQGVRVDILLDWMRESDQGMVEGVRRCCMNTKSVVKD